MKKFMFVLTAIAMSCAAGVANAQILYVNDYDYGYGVDTAPVYVNDGLSSGPIYAGGPRLPAHWRTAPINYDRAYNAYAYSPCRPIKVDQVLIDGRIVIRRGYVC